MNEEDFINSIDCKFPYGDKSAWTQIIDEGCKISSNAAFAALHEICRPPSGQKIASKQLREIADYWLKISHFPLASSVSKAAYRMIDHEELSVVEAIEIMNIIAKYQNEYSALAIAYFSCNDTEGTADEVYNFIISNWKEKSK